MPRASSAEKKAGANLLDRIMLILPGEWPKMLLLVLIRG
jgi:hypothetical protein